MISLIQTDIGIQRQRYLAQNNFVHVFTLDIGPSDHRFDSDGTQLGGRHLGEAPIKVAWKDSNVSALIRI